VFSGSFEAVLLYAGFVLQLMGTLTISASLLVKNREGFRSPFKPWPQLVYIIFSIWVMVFMLIDRPQESLFGLGIILVGFVVFLFDRKIKQEVSNN
jgi:basic amino acid/polyamine antiporter, APA family